MHSMNTHNSRNRLQDGGLIGVSAACIYVLLALFTYDPADGAWSTSGTNDVPSNSAGVFGAYIADLSFSMVGYWAYAVPILLAAKTLQIIFARGVRTDFSRELMAWRALDRKSVV